MNEIKQDIIDLVKKHVVISVSNLMVQYYRLNGKHLYLEVDDLGYGSIQHFLKDFDDLTLEIVDNRTFDIHIKLCQSIGEGGSNNSQSMAQNYTSTNAIRSYTTVKDEDHQGQGNFTQSKDKDNGIPAKKRIQTHRKYLPLHRRFRNSRNRSLTPGVSGFNFGQSGTNYGYNSLNPFDYRSWNCGQRYYYDFRRNSTEPYFMSHAANSQSNVSSNFSCKSNYYESSDHGSNFWTNYNTLNTHRF